ncbi:MAG: HAD family hydrolase [Myxococcota bacterium]
MTSQPIDWDTIEVVSWDLDGTLYELKPMVNAFKGLILRDLFSLGAWGTIRALFRLWRRLTTMGKVRKQGGVKGLPTPTADSSIKAQMVRWHSDAVAAVGAQPGVQELLKAIESSGRRQLVVTDYEAKEKLDSLALPVHFERVYEGEVLGAIKPSSVMFERILSEFDLEPRALLHIGDRDESDGVAARAAGCQVVILGKDFDDFNSLHRQLFAAN